MPETLTSPSTPPIARRPAWGKTSVQQRSRLLLQVADRIEQHLEYLAVAESWDNGKPIRETLNADLPLAVDHFRYFAGCLRAQEGSTAEIDETTVAYHFHEPLGWSDRLSRGTSRC
ncbi:lactaldehyde dehydrogenase [Klebsiella pneumoniae]|uniref:Lactaldehyde dehydrogenase n=1 Tax=Klebsiella pneumoniae TaxID=573 RepID=A0A4P0YDL2_KLEPN|nr:lactaldehyde dehydrogenase [Klebsiella pneumoniae]